jgi:hypothetical protein
MTIVASVRSATAVVSVAQRRGAGISYALTEAKAIGSDSIELLGVDRVNTVDHSRGEVPLDAFD